MSLAASSRMLLREADVVDNIAACPVHEALLPGDQEVETPAPSPEAAARRDQAVAAGETIGWGEHGRRESCPRACSHSRTVQRKPRGPTGWTAGEIAVVDDPVDLPAVEPLGRTRSGRSRPRRGRPGRSGAGRPSRPVGLPSDAGRGARAPARVTSWHDRASTRLENSAAPNDQPGEQHRVIWRGRSAGAVCVEARAKEPAAGSAPARRCRCRVIRSRSSAVPSPPADQRSSEDDRGRDERKQEGRRAVAQAVSSVPPPPWNQPRRPAPPGRAAASARGCRRSWGWSEPPAHGRRRSGSPPSA